MKHLLIDVDSKIPNLALMKISAWAKARGDEPMLIHHNSMRPKEPNPFRVWVSCVFTWNRSEAQRIADYWAAFGNTVQIGGSGVSLSTKLPDEIEAMNPDYSLYDTPEEKNDRAVGFVQRGCIRKCQFCIVPTKEGRLADNIYRPLEEWVPKGFTKILLLDNEFAACPHENEVLETVERHRWKLSITQGYDVRCMTPEKAARLARWKPWDLKFRERVITIAWDYFFIEPFVRRGIRMLLDAGFKGREIMVYCLAGFNTTHEQDAYRVRILWNEYGVRPFIMRYNMRKDDRWLNALARFVNRGPANYRNHTFEEYLKLRPIRA